MTNHTCTVPGCDKPVKRRGYCYGHYMKAWRYGTPTPVFESKRKNVKGRKFGTLTVIEEDGAKWLCECECGEHRSVSLGELNRRGDGCTCGVARNHRSSSSGYGAAHWRCQADRGPARAHRCVDCGSQAQQWSYNHDDPNEMTDHTGLPYSLDPDHYRPRCISCHKKFDLGVIASNRGDPQQLALI